MDLSGNSGEPSGFEPSLDHFVENTIPEPEAETTSDTEVNPGIANTKGFTNIISVPGIQAIQYPK